jgi:hypothetical protein
MKSSTDTHRKEEVIPEPWEIETVQRQFPQFSTQRIRIALEDCKRELGPETARERMMSCVESKLK